MKIIQQTSTQLTLRFRPWLIWIGGAVFVAGGLVFSAGLESRTLTCDRALNQCEITRSTLWQTTTKTLPINTVRNVELQAPNAGDAHCGIVLLTEQETIPLSSCLFFGLLDYSNPFNQIDAFIQSPTQPTLHLKQNNYGLVLSVGGLGLSMGGLLFFWAGHVTTCQFDKRSGKFIRKQQGLRGTQQMEYPLHRITGIQVECSTGYKGAGPVCRITLVLDSGDRVPLTSVYYESYRKQTAIADRIESFLR